MLNNLASLENQNGTMVILALQISVEHTPNWCILGAFHQLINANCTHVLYPYHLVSKLLNNFQDNLVLIN